MILLGPVLQCATWSPHGPPAPVPAVNNSISVAVDIHNRQRPRSYPRRPGYQPGRQSSTPVHSPPMARSAGPPGLLACRASPGLAIRSAKSPGQCGVAGPTPGEHPECIMVVILPSVIPVSKPNVFGMGAPLPTCRRFRRRSYGTVHLCRTIKAPAVR
jgi:hypothetical protein